VNPIKWIKAWWARREQRFVLERAKTELIFSLTHGDTKRVARLRQIIKEIEDELGK